MSSTVLDRRETTTVSVTAQSWPQYLIDTAIGPVSLQVTDAIESVADVWIALQEISACTAGQTYSAAEAWITHVAGPAGHKPVIAVGRSLGGEPLFLWAFERHAILGQGVLVWLGQGQSNYNMGLFTPEAAARLDRADMERLMRAVAASAGAAAVLLRAQPFEWAGQRNPFSTLPRQRDANFGYAVTLGAFDALYQARFGKETRRKIERRGRNLAKMGTLRFGWAESKQEKEALLDTVFSQRAVQFAKMGVADPFSGPVRAYYRALVMLDEDDPARLRLGYIRVGGTVAATFSGFACHKQLSMVISSLANCETQRYSPGIVLLRHQIEQACKDGFACYDIGIGAADYKERWCDVVRPLFDCLLAYNLRGEVIAQSVSAAIAAKRMVKQNRVIWPAVKAFRRHVLGKSVRYGSRA